MKPTPHRHVGAVRHEQLYAPRHDDPYLDAEKPPQDARCPECGVIFHKGRWTWGPRPKDAISAGLPGSKLYVGSWSEWITDPSRPIATGEA